MVLVVRSHKLPVVFHVDSVGPFTTPMSTASTATAITDPEPPSTVKKRTHIITVKKLVPQRRHRLVLSLDGGGVRSLITIKVGDVQASMCTSGRQ